MSDNTSSDAHIAAITNNDGERRYHLSNGSVIVSGRKPDGTTYCAAIPRGLGLAIDLTRPMTAAALRRARAAGRTFPSALTMLPESWHADILAGDPNIREDLRIIPEAEAAGWCVDFAKGSHDSASFTRGKWAVWSTYPTWTRARLRNGHYVEHSRHSALRDALRLP